MNDVVIVSAVRTPIGRLRGALSGVRPDDLAALVVAEAVARAGVDPASIESEAITNVNGGAIALGHPLGCSGARILTTLIHEMRRRAEAGEAMRYGLAMLCVGVGQGEATLIELS